MFVAVFVLALALSVSAQYGQQVSLELKFVKNKLHFQTPAPSPACPQGMTMAQAYGTTCYNGGFYFNGVCCEAPVSCFMIPREITFSESHNTRACCVSPGYGCVASLQWSMRTRIVPVSKLLLFGRSSTNRSPNCQPRIWKEEMKTFKQIFS